MNATGHDNIPRGPASVRDAREGDYGAVLRMNEADVEVLSPLDGAALGRLAALADAFWVAEAGREVAGFLVAMRERCGYWSDNYKWFDKRHGRFLYVDRIVVGEGFRGMGVASLLYGKLIGRARESGVPLVAAEVDVAPAYNEPSLRFHAKLGFREVGTKPYRDGITVSLQELDLGVPGQPAEPGPYR